MSTFSRTGAAALARASFASTSRSVSRRTLFTIPAPELEAKGVTEFAIRTFDRMPNMTYAFAIVRAIEAKFGVVLNLEVLKDADTLRPGNRLFVTLLKPVDLPVKEELRFEIPAPVIDPFMYGGVSLSEVENALRPSSADAISAITSDATVSESPSESGERVIRFSVEPRVKKAKKPRFLRSQYPPNRAEQAEDSEIVRALQGFSGGFFNGLDGVADKFSHLVQESQESREDSRVAREAESALKAEIAQEEAEAAKVIAEERAVRAAAKEEAAARALAAEEEAAAQQEAAVSADSEESASRLDQLKAKAVKAHLGSIKAARNAAKASMVAETATEKAMAQAERAEPALARAEGQDKDHKTTWRWFEKKE